jgi:microcystin-dependent protein
MPDNPYAIVPVGSVFPYAGDLSPANLERLVTGGWLPCDGRALDATNSEYTVLFEVIGTFHGEGFDEQGVKAGDFNLPDYRGRFLRGVAGAKATSRDPGLNERVAVSNKPKNAVGSVQDDAFKKHDHEYLYGNAGGSHHQYGATDAQPVDDGPRRTESVGGSETRPRNVYVNWIIRFKQV